MRRHHQTLLLLGVILGMSLAACSQNHTDPVSSSGQISLPVQAQKLETPSKPSTEMPTQSAVSQGGMDSAPFPKSSGSTSVSDEKKGQNVDIDLTKFSLNMLYAEVSNIEISPDDYKGKTIKLSGKFLCLPKNTDENGNPTSEEEIYVCMVSDAMACCATGVEFIPQKESWFWENQPEDGSEITISGVCNVFLDESGWFTVIQLEDAVVEQVGVNH